jgi:hypothetical protein
MLVACSAQPIFDPLAPSHPASPYAMESPMHGQSTTLAMHSGEKMPAHADRQVAGVQDNETNDQAAGPAPDATMGGMDMDHGAMGHGAMNMDMGTKTPEKIKTEAPQQQVDYTPAGAEPATSGTAMGHRPENQLDSGGKAKSTSKSGATLKPQVHDMHGMQDMEGMEGMREMDQMHPNSSSAPKNANDKTTSSTKSHSMHNMPGMKDMPGMEGM